MDTIITELLDLKKTIFDKMKCMEKINDEAKTATEKNIAEANSKILADIFFEIGNICMKKRTELTFEEYCTLRNLNPEVNNDKIKKEYSDYLWTIDMRSAITLMLDNDFYNDAIDAVTRLKEYKQTYIAR